MTDRSKQLDQLLEIAEAIRDRDLAILKSKEALRRDLEKKQVKLANMAQSEFLATVSDTAYRKNFEFPRQIWRNQKIQTYRQREIAIAAEIETHKTLLTKSYGRAEVLSKLRADAAAEKRRKLAG